VPVALRNHWLPSVGSASQASKADVSRGVSMRGDVVGTGFGGGPGISAVHAVSAAHSATIPRSLFTGRV
jgi:hypothetical protein